VLDAEETFTGRGAWRTQLGNASSTQVLPTRAIYTRDNGWSGFPDQFLQFQHLLHNISCRFDNLYKLKLSE
jgi:hypothetical protein